MIEHIEVKSMTCDYEDNMFGSISRFNNHIAKLQIELSCIVNPNTMKSYTHGPQSIMNNVSEYLAKEGRLSDECLGELISDKLNCKLTFKEIQQAIEHTFPEKIY